MYTDCNGNHYQSYDHACIIHGGETAASLAAEDAWREEEAIKQDLDAIEARGGPRYSCRAWAEPTTDWTRPADHLDDVIPF